MDDAQVAALLRGIVERDAAGAAADGGYSSIFFTGNFGNVGHGASARADGGLRALEDFVMQVRRFGEYAGLTDKV